MELVQSVGVAINNMGSKVSLFISYVDLYIDI